MCEKEEIKFVCRKGPNCGGQDKGFRLYSGRDGKLSDASQQDTV